MSIISQSDKENPGGKRTIIDCVSIVLAESKKPLSLYEIFQSILDRKLYDFGAKYPIEVVRVEIMRNCENTVYSKGNQNPIFYLSLNASGQRVFSLIANKKTNSESESPDDVSTIIDHYINEKILLYNLHKEVNDGIYGIWIAPNVNRLFKVKHQFKSTRFEFREKTWFPNRFTNEIPKGEEKQYNGFKVSWLEEPYNQNKPCNMIVTVFDFQRAKPYLDKFIEASVKAASKDIAKTTVTVLNKEQEIKESVISGPKEMDQEETNSQEISFDSSIDRSISNTTIESKQDKTSKKEDGFSSELLAIADKVISTYFVNGMRKGASIAKKKFRSAYFEQTGMELSENIDIDDLVASAGYEYSGKIYSVSSENKKHIRQLVETAFESGNHIVCYEEMYVQNTDFMSAAGIFSSDLLKTILKQLLPEYCYKRSYFSESDGDSLDTDITACFDGTLMLSFNDIKNRLPYSDIRQIRIACSHSNNLVRTKEETYVLTEKLQLAESDIVDARKTIEDDINRQGFSVIQRISATISGEMNPDIPEQSLKEAIYSLYLATVFERKHSIITLPGASFSPSEVMLEYCKSLSEATLEELYDYEEELTSKTTYSLEAAYSSLIRVDKERFVSREAVLVNVEATDTALSLFVQNKIIPLISVNSFTSFPEIPGYTWNLYLLDSYCKHFSARFQSLGGPAKSKPVGAIFPVQMRFTSYEELLAQVVAENPVQLNPDYISKFLTDNAYTLRKIDSTSIVTQAQQIRLQKER